MATPLLPISSLLHSPRKHRIKHRTTLLALVALVALSCYVLFLSNPTLDIPIRSHVHTRDHLRLTYSDKPQVPLNNSSDARKQHPAPVAVPVQPSRPQISLSPSDELAALAAFLAALPHNIIPPSVDPAQPLDPQLVLDFDTRSEHAKNELAHVVDDVWTRYPVMLFTKLHSADSREVRYMFSNLNLNPSPLVFEVDQREDAQVLLPLLTRLTHVPALPIILIGGQPIAADTQDRKAVMAEIRGLHESGELARLVLEAGAKLDAGRRRKGGKGK
ncbi:hypothetical protein F5I97DRAFT_1803204 [Phlebopus sp. FC_14]|nr:hypothetical protein F5I97DRAFT_1803204 [Phlebopus sp. FC_14]